jgi:hypothetical protein
MPLEISPEDLRQHFRKLAAMRWQKATPAERSRAAQHAAGARWAAFREWKASHGEEAAAAASIAKAMRSLRTEAEATDDEIVERLEGRLARAQEASATRLPWSSAFRRRALGKER